MRARVSALIAGVGLCVVMGEGFAHAEAGDEGEIAELLIELVRAGQAVVSEHPPLVNDASKADKGFTDKFVVSQVIDKFKAKTRVDLSHSSGIPQSEILLAMLESELEVVLEAQSIINKQGIAFKGFVPSAFARKVGQKFLRRPVLGSS